MSAEWCFKNPEEAAKLIATLESKNTELQRQLDEMAGQEPVAWLYPDAGSMTYKICQTEPRPPLAFPVYAKHPNTASIVEQAKAEEREACAKVCDAEISRFAGLAEKQTTEEDKNGYLSDCFVLSVLASKIRARKP